MSQTRLLDIFKDNGFSGGDDNFRGVRTIANRKETTLCRDD